MKKIAIVCGSPSSEMLAPFDDKEWEIWVLGNRISNFRGKRVNRIFEIHDDLSEHGDAQRYAEFLRDLNIPLIVGEGFPVKAENITTFPFADAEKLYGSTYLTSSPAYMMAYAILQGATHIGVYGVDLAIDNHEYFWQRPCMEAWVGFAKGRGIEITIPEVSPLGKSDYVEGRKSGGKPNFKKPPFTQEDFESNARKHEEKIQSLRNEIREKESLLDTHNGAKQVYERLAMTARATEAGQDIKSLSHSTLIK